MFRIISLAFAIAQSTVYADDHDWEEPTGWEFIFPDEVFFIHNLYLGCPRRKFFATGYSYFCLSKTPLETLVRHLAVKSKKSCFFIEHWSKIGKNFHFSSRDSSPVGPS